MTARREPEHSATRHQPHQFLPLRVLVVDDSDDLVESLAMVLRFIGHDVCTAGSGAQALERMAADSPQVVLMDVSMPGMSGYDVARRASLQEWRSTMKLVAMTGWGRDGDRERALAAGFDVHVVKPLNLEQLRELLDSIALEGG